MAEVHLYLQSEAYTEVEQKASLPLVGHCLYSLIHFILFFKPLSRNIIHYYTNKNTQHMAHQVAPCLNVAETIVS